MRVRCETNKRSNITPSVAGSFVAYRFALLHFLSSKALLPRLLGRCPICLLGASVKRSSCPFPFGSSFNSSTSLTLLSHQHIANTFRLCMASDLYHEDHCSSPCILRSIEPEITLHTRQGALQFFLTYIAFCHFPFFDLVACYL
jgi:hypothetical protein